MLCRNASGRVSVNSGMPWPKRKPRAMLTTRIREEYQQGLDELFQELRKDPRFERLQKYDILEHLLKPLTTPEGRAQVRRELEGE